MLRANTALVVCLSLVSPVAGQALVRDINQVPNPYPWAHPQGSDPEDFVALGDLAIFSADDGLHGRELWRSDGTAAGTVLLKDIFPGFLGSDPSSLVVCKDRVFFRAESPGIGTELWMTDGTTVGTHLITDWTPGAGGSISHDPLIAVGDRVFFTASDPVSPQMVLGVTDGTERGTYVVWTGRAQLLGAAIGLVFFRDKQDDTLWRSNGTAAGTLQLGNTFPVITEAMAADTSASSFVELGGSAYFLAAGDNSGIELWKSDGTSSGTELAADFVAGPGDSDLDYLTAIAGSLYFSLNGGYPHVSDGTVVGTTLLVDANGGTGVTDYHPVGADLVLFRTGGKLRVTDGTPEGTEIIGSQLYATQFTTFPGGIVRFTIGSTIWRTDGTSEGTWPMVDTGATELTGLEAAGGYLWFSAKNEDEWREPWRSDGTAAGTFEIEVNEDVECTLGSDPDYLLNYRGSLLFAASDGEDRELWVSDGTEEGTFEIDVWPGPESSEPEQLTRSGGLVYFSAKDHESFGRVELHVTDGTPEGTRSVGKRVDGLIVATDTTLFFEAETSDGVELLWTSDGTWSGTQPLLGLQSPDHLRAVGDSLYFSARLGEPTVDPWVSDGTAGGTLMLIELAGHVSGYHEVADGVVFFSGGPTPGIYFSDGSVAGTGLVDSFPTGSVPDFLSVGDVTLFADSFDLWRTDGTAAGTYLLLDGASAQVGNGVTILWDTAVRAGERAYFWVESDDDGLQLWTADGTITGTGLVADVEVGNAFSFHAPGLDPFEPEIGATGSGDAIAFQAADGVHGREIWVHNAGGTHMLNELVPGGAGAHTASFTRAGDHVFFTSSAYGYGAEIYAFPFPLAGAWVAEPFGAGCASQEPARLEMVGTPEPDGAVSLSVTGAAESTPTAILYSLGDLGIPLQGGCEWLLGFPNWLLTVGVTDGSGTYSLPLTWPADAVLVALPLYFQSFVSDPDFGSGGGVGFTNGLEVRGGP